MYNGYESIGCDKSPGWTFDAEELVCEKDCGVCGLNSEVMVRLILLNNKAMYLNRI